MSDLLSVLPSFDARPFTHILPKLEKALVSCSDLLTLDALHVAKRAQLPASEVKKLADALVQSLSSHAVSPSDPSDPMQASGEPRGDGGLNLTTTAPDFRSGDVLLDQWMISTLDDKLDIALSGGIHSGYLTEITGERFVDEEVFDFRNPD
jgi:DNA repair protein RAD57